MLNQLSSLFSPVKKLFKLAEKYGVKIIYCLKFHCELNPIEGQWCSQKGYIRKRTDQTNIRLISLLNESRTNFIQSKLANKLFWNRLHGYKNKKSYSEIIIQYFSGKSKGKNESHTKVSNSQIF